ncbi:ABC transporter permease [bacterium]|nr:ABC transporter permease [bacterium]
MLHYLNDTFIEALGAVTLRFLRETGAFTKFCFKASIRAITPPWNYRLIMDQAMAIGVRSLPIALITAVFVGLVMVLQTGVQLIKFGAKNTVPGISFIANAREMVPVFTAFVVGARVAASIAAELGTMRVTEQIDAMDILNVDPMRYLVAPRIIAATALLPLISVLCLVAGFFGGMIVAATGLNIHPVEYYIITLKFANLQDVYTGLVKTVVFGNIIALVGCYFGYKSHGGAEGVGRSTTTAVVVSLVLILLWDFVLTRWILIFTGKF